MNSPTNNSNNWNTEQPSLSSLISPLRVELTKSGEGWCVEISSLTPCDAMMALAREDVLEESTILSGLGDTQWVACVDGPVELGDAKAIVREVEQSGSPLGADFRMKSIVTSLDGKSIRAHVRDYDDALTLTSSAISLYTTAFLGDSVSSPDLGLIDSVLSKTGLLSIRPIETAVYSTFVDVGVSTNGVSELADSVLIYDIHSNTWHGD